VLNSCHHAVKHVSATATHRQAVTTMTQAMASLLQRIASRCCVQLVPLRLAWRSGSRQGASAGIPSKRAYFQRFPTLFAPLYSDASREMTRQQLNDNVWALEQNLELGPLQTPFRCVVIKLKDDTLWVHAPLAPTEEFFELVKSCSDGPVAHVVIPT